MIDAKGSQPLKRDGVRVKSVRPIGTADVYNMEVESHHNFAVDGGFIVHNCMDAMRYFVMQVIKRRNVAHTFKNTSKYF